MSGWSVVGAWSRRRLPGHDADGVRAGNVKCSVDHDVRDDRTFKLPLYLQTAIVGPAEFEEVLRHGAEAVVLLAADPRTSFKWTGSLKTGRFRPTRTAHRRSLAASRPYRRDRCERPG